MNTMLSNRPWISSSGSLDAASTLSCTQLYDAGTPWIQWPKLSSLLLDQFFGFCSWCHFPPLIFSFLCGSVCGSEVYWVAVHLALWRCWVLVLSVLCAVQLEVL